MQDLEQIVENITRTQNYIITFHGPSSERKNKESLPLFSKEFEIEVYVPSDETLIINIPIDLPPQFSSSPTYISKKVSPLSFFFNGMNGNTIKIDKRCNHILMRDCHDVKIELEEVNISGIDIIKSRNIYLKIPLYEFTNIEYTSDVELFGLMKQNSQIIVRNSQQIYFENVRLPVHMFENKQFIKKDSLIRSFPFI